MTIILASQSPRRQELLKKITEDFIVIKSNFDESSVKYDGDVADYVVELAEKKAKEVAKNVKKPHIIVSADTVVVFENNILGKPKNKEEATCMLRLLSGNNHKVCTGLYILDMVNERAIHKAVFTDVKFSKLTDKEIQEYIATGSPMDKAGAYGIQDSAAIFVEEIRGCYYNVMGLPVNVLYNLLKQLD
ncbi:MAG: Maf-like protein [Sarcina sp.]